MILIAEDEPLIRTLLSEAFSDLDILVLEAADGVEALEILKAKPAIKLLLSDVKMPRMNGYDLIQKAIQLRPALKIIMMSGYAAELPPAELMHAREIRMVPKPFDISHMTDLVREMLGRP